MAESNILQAYRNDFEKLLGDVQNVIDNVIPTLGGEPQKSKIEQARRNVDELREIISQMEMEILQLPSPERTRQQARLREKKSQFERINSKLRSVSENRDRRELLGDGSDTMIDFDDSGSDQRERLLSGTARLGESSRRLQDSHRVALETESIGINVLSTLKGQRETITRARDTLMEADSHIDKASRTLKSMARRMATNKMITGAIILILVVLIVLIIWSKLF